MSAVATRALDGFFLILPDPLRWERSEVYATILTDAGSAAQTGDDPDSLIETAGEHFGVVPDDSVDDDMIDAGDVLADLRGIVDDALAGNVVENGAAWARVVTVEGRRVLVIAGGTDAEAAVERAVAYGFVHVLGITQAPNA